MAAGGTDCTDAASHTWTQHGVKEQGEDEISWCGYFSVRNDCRGDQNGWKRKHYGVLIQSFLLFALVAACYAANTRHRCKYSISTVQWTSNVGVASLFVRGI